MSHFFAYLSRMKLINRWGLMRNTHMENIQEHSLQVAMIAHGLAVIRNKYFSGELNPERVMALAVFHEVGEVITGDLATPIKYFNPEIKQAYSEIEEIAKNKLYNMLPLEMQDDFKSLFFTENNDEENWIVVKAADKICAYIKCLEELKAGNQEFSKAKKAIEKEIKHFKLLEVDYFMDNFINSFSLTLDELN